MSLLASLTRIIPRATWPFFPQKEISARFAFHSVVDISALPIQPRSRCFSTTGSEMSAAPDGMILAPVADAAFIFNYFPRPVLPSLQGCLEFWAGGGKRIAEHHKDDGNFISTHLHMGFFDDSQFQLVNYGVFANFDALPFMTVKDPTAFFKIVGAGPGSKPPIVKAMPGGYKEIEGFSRSPKPTSLPKWRPAGSVAILASFAFEVDIPRGPPAPGTPPGPPGLRPATSDIIEKAKSDFEAGWVEKAGASILARHAIVNDVFLYRRHTHGVYAFVMRAECDMSGAADAAAVADKAKEAVAELRTFLAGSEFLRDAGFSTDVDVYKIIINGEGVTLEENEYGV